MSQNNGEEKGKLLDKSDLKDDYLQRASYLGTILPLLDIFYEIIIEDRLKKYDLNIVKEFWIYFGLFIFSVVYYLVGFKFELIIFFAFATVFTLVIFNLDYFKNRLVTNDDYEIDKFIKSIEERKKLEVIEFIKEYQNKIKELDIKAIISSSHGKNWIIYDYLSKYQNISENILKYLIEQDKLLICGEKTYLKYLKSFKVGLSFDTYSTLVNKFQDKKEFIKLLNLYNPAYSQNKSFFRTCSGLNQSFYISIKRGLISSLMAIFSLLIAILAVICNIQQFSSNGLFDTYGSVGPIFYSINLLFAIILFTMFIYLLLASILIGISKFFWIILGFFAPENPQM